LTGNIEIADNSALSVQRLIKAFEKLLNDVGIKNHSDLLTAKSPKVAPSAVDKMQIMLNVDGFQKLIKSYTNVLEITAEIIVLIEEDTYFSDLNFPVQPRLGHDNTKNLKELARYVLQVKDLVQPMIDDEIGNDKNNQLLKAISTKKKELDKGFFYEFTKGDLNRIQVLVNELREEITASDLFEKKHQQRLLRRLEAMQSEMHKKMSDVDHIYGLIGDAGVVMGKLGKDAKPIVDRIKELTKITWNTQARAEELPSIDQNPLLEHKED
jgi:hypothetical protein